LKQLCAEGAIRGDVKMDAHPATDRMLSHREGAVGWMTFNNPARHNAVSLEMWQAAEAILTGFRDDPAVRVVVVTGAGGKAFVSGADISKFESERAAADAVAHYNATTDRVYGLLHGFPKPTIALIRGHCIGGGAGLAVCCDLRFCNEAAGFAVPAARLGLGYGIAGIRRMMDVIGPANTCEIFFTARRFSAAEALAMGLVNRVLADDALDAWVREIAAAIAANAPLTIAAVKAAVTEALKDPAQRDTARVEAMVAACFASADYTEGRRAFMEKRPPQFQGR
jgi:enoyl-CoA hydratase/carnithine racemase